MIHTNPTVSRTFPEASEARPFAGDHTRVWALAALGFLTLGTLALGWATLGAEALISLCSFNLLGCLLFIPAHWLMGLLRAVCAPGRAPAGVLLRRRDSPEFFKFIDGVRARLRAPSIDVACITSDCNAAMLRSWRFGIVGRRQNCLVIGLTLLKTLTVAQFEAVVAHEVAHLSAGHARSNALIGRLHLAFARLDAAVVRLPKRIHGPVRSLLRWYMGALRAAVSPLLREWEFEADAVSVQLTSPQSAGQALIASQILKAYLVEKYWPTIFNAARELAEPAGSPFTQFDAGAIAAIGQDVERWQRAAVTLATSSIDTHPCLRERLQALGESPAFQPPASGQAADQLLGSVLCGVANTLDVHWRSRIQGSWRTLHQSTQNQKRQLQELREAALTSALDEHRSLALANLEEQVGEGSVIASQMRSALRERFPQSLPVQFAWGRQLLQMKNTEGVAVIESVIAKDPNALIPGAHLLRHHFRLAGQESLAERWQQRHALGLAASSERQGVLPSDQVGPHHLQGEILVNLRLQLESIPHLGRAYLVRKRVQHLPQYPLFVLGFKTAGLFKPYDPDRARSVARTIRERVAFPGTLLIMNVDEKNSRVAAKFRRVLAARVA
jgi:Zn-dependent protease with chaperone function